MDNVVLEDLAGTHLRGLPLRWVCSLYRHIFIRLLTNIDYLVGEPQLYVRALFITLGVLLPAVWYLVHVKQCLPQDRHFTSQHSTRGKNSD